MHNGFSMIELLVTIAISTILTAIAVPSFTEWATNNQTETRARLLHHYLVKTRNAAINHGKRMVFCGVNQQQECIRSNFKSLVVFHDQNKNAKIDENEMPLFYFDLAFNGSVFLRASNQKYISFNSTGYANQFGSITLCPQNYSRVAIQRISINRSGRAYIKNNRGNQLLQLRNSCGELMAEI